MVQGLGLGSFIAVAQLQSLVRNLDPKSLAVWLKKKKKGIGTRVAQWWCEEPDTISSLTSRKSTFSAFPSHGRDHATYGSLRLEGGSSTRSEAGKTSLPHRCVLCC